MRKNKILHIICCYKIKLLPLHRNLRECLHTSLFVADIDVVAV